MKPQLFYSFLLISSMLLFSCSDDTKSDAYGNFEVTSVTISAKGNGDLIKFNVDEGSQIKRDQQIGLIDTAQLHLEKLALVARMESLDDRLQEAAPEIAVLIKRNENLRRERDRTKVLVEKKAATQKQLDDYNGEVDFVEQQISSAKRQIGIANRSILSERKPIRAQIDILQKKIEDCKIKSPLSGTVLTKLREPGEFVGMGTPLLKVANLDELKLRAYTSAQLLQGVALNDNVRVLIDDGEEKYRELEGSISWIANEAEFTPKSIETKEERVNLVYALDVQVKNDGTLKIGMPGEVRFPKKSSDKK